MHLALPFRSRRRPPAPRRAFTIIELLIAVLVIGIITSVSLAKFADAREKAYTSAMQSDLRNYAIAQELAYDDAGQYGDTAAMRTVRGFRWSDHIVPDSQDLATPTESWYVRVQHAKSAIACGMGAGQPADAAANRMRCTRNGQPVGGGTGETPPPATATGPTASFWAYETGTTGSAPVPMPESFGFTVGQSVTFDGTETIAGDTTIASWSWQLGDGATATGAQATHTYASAGSYTVTLTVTDADGLSDVLSRPVNVTAVPNVAPSAAFTVSTATPLVGQSVTFDGTGSADADGTIASYAWDMGDWQDNSGATVSHAFASAGAASVTLIVTDDQGAADTLTQTVTVHEAPTAAFTIAPAAPTTTDVVTLDATNATDDGAIASYAWLIEGTVAATGVTTTHTFGSAGSHSVRLIVTDNFGAADTLTQTVSVTQAVLASAAYAWGGNGSGRLGVGTTVANYDTATAIVGGHTFQAITAGSNHGCALTSAGDAYCWGQDFYGQVGNDAVQSGNLTSPVAVAGGRKFSVIVSGANNTCALSDGAAYCWGQNGAGQNGKGTSGGQDNTPVAVAGGLTFTDLVGGASHMCGLTASGAAYCWGLGTSGELGRGVGGGSSSPTPVPVSGGLSFVQLAAGANHTCGLTSAGVMYCWGDNANLQLGQGGTSTVDVYGPTPVTGGLTFTAIAAGYNRTCGMTSDKSYCWGAAYVGDNTANQSSTPVAVNGTGAGGHVFTEMALGGATCGLASTGLAYCWGTNKGPSGPVYQWQPVTPVSNTRTFVHLWRGGHSGSSYALATP